MNEQINILISSCGAIALGPSLVELIKEMNINANIIGLDMSEENACHLLVDKFYKSPRGGTEEFVNFVKNICINEKIDIILGTSVENVIIPILERKNEFDELGVKVPSCDINSIKIANNKIKMLRHLETLDTPKAKFLVPKNISEFESFALELGYPERQVVVKPSSLSGSRGFKILKKHERLTFEEIMKKPSISPYITLEEYCDALKNKKGKFPEILMMEYLPGQDYSVYIYAENGIAKCVIPMKRLDPRPGFSVTSQVDLNETIIEKAKLITEHFNLNWNVSIQMKLNSKNIPVVYEINPRIAGSIQMTKAAGVNFLEHGILKILNKDTCIGNPIDNVKMLRYYKAKFLRK